jgi:electron transport complex protein RnfG
MKKEMIRLSGILCAITLVAALLLAFVNKITAPEIQKAALVASENAMKQIIPEAESFEKENEAVSKAMKSGEVIGYCVTVETSGFGGKIEMMVGIGSDDTVKGIEILSHSETAGLGAKATSSDFKDRFKGKKPNLTVVKTQTESVEQVQAITGATVTSRAVSDGIRNAYEIVKETKGGDK